MKKYSIVLATFIVVATLGSGPGCGRNPLDAGIRAVENGDLQKAKNFFTTALEQDPGNIHALMNLSIVRMKQGDTEAALTGFRQVADLAQDDSRPLEFMAGIYMDNNQWQEAAKVLGEAATRDPRSPCLLTYQALVDLNTSDIPAAKARLERVLAMDPAYPPALFNMAVIEKDWLKNPAEGRRYFQRYLAVAKNDPHTVIAKASLQERAPAASRKTSAPLPAPPTVANHRKDPPPAPVTPRDPLKAAAALRKAVAHHQAHESEKAIQEYTTAIQSDPTLARAHFNLGLLLREKGDLAGARASFERALQCTPGMTDARYMLGLILDAQGDEAGAITQFKTITEKVPNHAPSHLALGLIYKKDKTKLVMARKELSLYLELDPDGVSAKEVRNWLKYQR